MNIATLWSLKCVHSDFKYETPPDPGPRNNILTDCIKGEASVATRARLRDCTG